MHRVGIDCGSGIWDGQRRAKVGGLGHCNRTTIKNHLKNGKLKEV